MFMPSKGFLVPLEEDEVQDEMGVKQVGSVKT